MQTSSADRIALLTLILLSIFLVLPYGLSATGIGITTSLAFTMFIIALTLDAFLTRAGFLRGGKETNPFYSLIKNRMAKDHFLVFSTGLGIILGVFILIFLRNPMIILTFAMLLFVGPLLTSVTLSGVGSVHLDDSLRKERIDD